MRWVYDRLHSTYITCSEPCSLHMLKQKMSGSRLRHPYTLSPSQHFGERQSHLRASLDPSFPQPELHLLFIFPLQIWRIPPTPTLFPGLLPIHFSHLFQWLWLLQLLVWAPKSSTLLSPRTLYFIVVKLPSVANLPFHW